MTREDNPTPSTPQSDKRIDWNNLRGLIAKSDFWRPDTIPTSLRILGADGLRAGSNKWGRVQIYAKAELEDGRIVQLAMSRRCAAGLIECMDREGIDQGEITQSFFEVKKTGRGLDTGYAWTEIPEPAQFAARRAAAIGGTPVPRGYPSGKPIEAPTKP